MIPYTRSQWHKTGFARAVKEIAESYYSLQVTLAMTLGCEHVRRTISGVLHGGRVGDVYVYNVVPHSQLCARLLFRTIPQCGVFVKTVNGDKSVIANGKDNDELLCRAYNARERTAEAARSYCVRSLHHTAFTRRRIHDNETQRYFHRGLKDNLVHHFKFGNEEEKYRILNCRAMLTRVIDIAILSVRLSRSGTVSKRLNTSSYFLQRMVTQSFFLFPALNVFVMKYINFTMFDQYLAIYGKRYKIGHSHYGTVTGNHMRSIEPLHFR